MRVKRLTAVWIALVLSTCALTGFDVQPVQATLHLIPQTVQLDVNTTTVLDLAITQVSGLYGVEAHLRFDPDALEIIDADPTRAGVQIEAGTFPSPDFVALNQVDNQTGTIDYAVTQLSPREPREGSGVVAHITIRAKRPSTTLIEIERYMLTDTSATAIDAVGENGQVTVRRNVPWLLVGASGALLLLLVGGVGYATLTKRKVRENHVDL
jgi:hypothetical protein